MKRIRSLRFTKVVLLTMTLAGCITEQQVIKDNSENFKNLNAMDANFLQQVSITKNCDTAFYAFKQKLILSIDEMNENNTELSMKHTDGVIKILISEGDPYFALNWKYIRERYGKYLSRAYNDWLTHLDETEKIVKDAALMVTPDKLREYIIFLEDFIDKNRNFADLTEVENRLKWYVNLYLHGLDNSPVYDYSSRIMKSEYCLSYEKFLSENMKSKYYPQIKKVYDRTKSRNFYL